MKSRFFAMLWALSLLLPRICLGQTPPYPIIFIHGIDSEDNTWRATVHYFRDQFGWSDPYKDDQDPNGQGVFHAVLDASDLSTHYGLDVVFDFPNEHNELYNGNLYAINFHNWWNAATSELLPRQNRSLNTSNNFSESNEAALTKQGCALGEMIRKVLLATGAQKVILVGHSMGGLVAREYLQRREATGAPKWWAYPNEVEGHRVAKLVTIGTPHAGSNMTEFGGFVGVNEKSEAARDLTYNYFTFGPPNFSDNPDHGVYLFGSAESIIPVNVWPNTDIGYLHRDVNCNGGLDDVIAGINSNVQIRADNLSMLLPREVDYTWIVSDVSGVNGDGAVRADRQYLESAGDTLMIRKLHSTQTGDYKALLRGLDEPDKSHLAYEIELGRRYHFFSNLGTNAPVTDTDWFAFNLPQSGAVAMYLTNLPAQNNNATTQVALYEKNDTDNALVSGVNFGGRNTIYLTSPMLVAGAYLLRVVSAPNAASWNNPATLAIVYRDPNQPSYHLNVTESVANAIAPAVAVEPNGASHVVWQEDRDGNWEIYFAKIDGAGNFILRDVRVTNTSGASTKPDISIDGSGRSYIVWLEGWEVKFCVLDQSGSKIVNDVTLSGGDSDNPAISTIASGRSHVVWQRREITFYYVYFAQFNANGQRIGNEVRLSNWDLIGGIDKYPAIDNDAAGNSYVLWRDFNHQAPPFTHALYYARVNDNRSLFAQLRVLNQENADHPAIAQGGPYLFLVCSDNRGSGSGIYSITNVDRDYRVDEAGVNATNPAVGYDDTQTAFISWEDERDQNKEIYFTKIDAAGVKAPDTRVTDTPGISSNPEMETDGAGNFFLVWQDNSSGDWDVWITRGPSPFNAQVLPDLTVTAVSGPNNGTTNAPVEASVTVQRTAGPLNKGTYVFVHVYASLDAQLDANDVVIGQSTETQFLNNELNTSGTATALIPCLLPENAGTYYFIAAVDPTNFHPEQNESNNVLLGGQVAVIAGATGLFLLSFPLQGLDPFAASINSVFDHNMINRYAKDEIVIGYTGEKGEKKFGDNQDGYRQLSSAEFFVNGNYTAASFGKTFLFYDGHPGIDYRAASGVEIYAVADGIVSSIEGTKDTPTGFGTLDIDHENGYHTLYLHLSKYAKEKDERVTRGDLIGYVGNTSPVTIGEHLHFEVRKAGIAIDPYGWQGIGDDTYTLHPNAFLWADSTEQTEWNFDETFEKWRTKDALNQGVNVALGGEWVIDPGEDPAIISSALTHVQAEQFPELELRMTAKGSGVSRAQVFFKLAPEQKFSESLSVEFELSVQLGNDPQIYRAVLSHHPLWRGRIIEIRIDPIAMGDPLSDADLLYIDYVKFNRTITSVENQSEVLLPKAHQLYQNYPNPFNPETTITLALPRAGRVKIQLYNLLGQRVRTLLERHMAPGYAEIVWDGKDENDHVVPSGVYLVRMQAEEFSATRKAVVLR